MRIVLFGGSAYFARRAQNMGQRTALLFSFLPDSSYNKLACLQVSQFNEFHWGGVSRNESRKERTDHALSQA
jgi:hypothetical protein